MANVRKVGNVTVNDGEGLLDNEGLIDSLIVDVNELVKDLVSGQYIKFVRTVDYMIQKLANLRNGIKTELESRDKTIEDLKRMNDELVEKLCGVPVDRESSEHNNSEEVNLEEMNNGKD